MKFDTENKKIAEISIKATKGFSICILVFYQTSVVGVILDKKERKQLEKELKKYLKENKVSLIDRNQARKEYWDDFSEKYAYMSLEELICLSNDNFEIEYDDIIKMNITSYRKNVRRAGEVQDELGQISIKCDNNKYHFNHYYQSDAPKYSMLKEITDRITQE